MSKEELLKSIEEEPISEDDIVCDSCGRPASWDVIDDNYKVNFVCHKHHTRLLEKNLVFAERRIGPDTWEEIDSYKILLNEWDLEKHERGETN